MDPVSRRHWMGIACGVVATATRPLWSQDSAAPSKATDWIQLFPVQHQPTVADCPAGPSRNLLADEAVLGAQSVVGERILVEEVPKGLIELVVPVVDDSQ